MPSRVVVKNVITTELSGAAVSFAAGGPTCRMWSIVELLPYDHPLEYTLLISEMK